MCDPLARCNTAFVATASSYAVKKPDPAEYQRGVYSPQYKEDRRPSKNGYDKHGSYDGKYSSGKYAEDSPHYEGEKWFGSYDHPEGGYYVEGPYHPPSREYEPEPYGCGTIKGGSNARTGL